EFFEALFREIGDKNNGFVVSKPLLDEPDNKPLLSLIAQGKREQAENIWNILRQNKSYYFGELPTCTRKYRGNVSLNVFGCYLSVETDNGLYIHSYEDALLVLSLLVSDPN